VNVAVRTRGSRSFAICLFRSAGRWPNPDRFDTAWLEDRPGVEVTTAPQRPASIAITGDGFVHLAWYGGSASDPAHQIRYARFSTTGGVQLAEEVQPFLVTGFDLVYPGASGDELWQEHPCIATGSDGLLYLVWEGRDATRVNSQGSPQPGIAWAVRGGDGAWSVSGPVGAPLYAEVDSKFPSQSRPTLVTGASGEMHIVCYGSVGGVQQILHGVLRDRKFSGWGVVSPSSADQRHASAASDPTGRVHIAWREGVAGSGVSGTSVAIFYASLDPQGRVEGPIRISPTAENASTPSISVSGGLVSIAWVAWTPGATNSEGKRDNGFPSDAGSVEGKLEVRCRPAGSSSFGPVAVLDAGPVAYPTWACRGDDAGAPEALLWTRAGPGNRNELLLGRIRSR
jgi:hypothetical protein